MADFLGLPRGVLILGLELERCLLAAVIVLAGLTLRRLLSRFTLNRLAAAARRTTTEVDDLLIEAARRPLSAGILLTAIGFAISTLSLPRQPIDIHRISFRILIVAAGIVVVWFFFRLIDGVAVFYTRKASTPEHKVDDALIPLFRKLLKIFAGVTAALVILQNMGYSVSGLIAGLGIGGLAVALAAKDTLANFFGSITLLLDRPFRIGDWVKTDEFEGVVEEIGFRSTRVRTFPRTQVIVPNGMLVNMTIDNFQAMPMRRIQIRLPVAEQTGAPRIRALLAGIERLLGTVEGIAPENRLVRLDDVGAGTLEIVVRCFTRDLDQDRHTAIRQALLLAIIEQLEALGIELTGPVALPRPGGWASRTAARQEL
jgi:MscS family membrane protein